MHVTFLHDDKLHVNESKPIEKIRLDLTGLENTPSKKHPSLYRLTILDSRMKNMVNFIRVGQFCFYLVWKKDVWNNMIYSNRILGNLTCSDEIGILSISISSFILEHAKPILETCWHHTFLNRDIRIHVEKSKLFIGVFENFQYRTFFIESE